MKGVLEMCTLTELRRMLKAVGFGVRTQSMSFGRAATYYHIETGRKLQSNVFSISDVVFWELLFSFRKAHWEILNMIQQTEDITGLI